MQCPMCKSEKICGCKIIGIIIVVLLAVGGYFLLRGSYQTPTLVPTPTSTVVPKETGQPAETPSTTQIPVAGEPEVKEAAVKEFFMTSFVEIVDGQPKPQYSLKEITVNKGDKVKIKITVTKGAHNFNLDEFNIKADTPLNQEVTAEFTADKTGEFIYYCSMPGHRANGHWGTLKVLAQ